MYDSLCPAVGSDSEFGRDDLASSRSERSRLPQLTLEFQLLGILMILKGETLCTEDIKRNRGHRLKSK